MRSRKIFYLTQLVISNSSALFCPTCSVISHQSRPLYLLASNSDDNLAWLKGAMNNNGGNSNGDEMLFMNRPLTPGLAGFAVDPEMGFVAILASEKRSTQKEQRAVYAVVCPRDVDRVKSPEALCLVQLAGGIDIGAAVFPPDTLARLGADEFGETVVETAAMLEKEWKSRVDLLGVDVVCEDRVEETYQRRDSNDGNDLGALSSGREEKIVADAPKLFEAVKKLPGLVDIITLPAVIDAMRVHADNSGYIDKNAFMNLLGTLRKIDGDATSSRVKFILTLCDKASSKQGLVEVPTFQAIALSMRYRIRINVSEKCLESDVSLGSNSMSDKFPAFRPLKELVEDAQVMEGFISTMFFKETAPRNEDKL